MAPGMFRTALILGLLCCVGPFSIDMYLPAMPAVGRTLGGTVTATQMTITAYFIAFGLAQIVYGPLADKYGRKPPLILGLVLFIAGSAGCVIAPDISTFIAFRFLQGLGGAAAMVIPRAIIRDQYTGPAATRLMAMVMLVISVSPMLAPLAGSGVILLAGWRMIFVVLAIAGLASILVTMFLQPETLAPEHRVPIDMKNLWAGTKVLVSDPVFMGATFVGGFGFSSFLVFLASASFVYTGYYGLSSVEFSLAFAANALGFFSASQFAGPLGERIGMGTMIARGVTGFLVMAVLLAALVGAGFDSLYLIIGCLFLANACLGLVIPTSMVVALDDHGEIAGLASSLGGMLLMLVGGLMTAVVAPFFSISPLPMVVAIALCAVLTFIVLRLTAAASARNIPVV